MIIANYYTGKNIPDRWYNEAAFLNSTQIPSSQEIINFQISKAKCYENVFRNNHLIQQFNNDLKQIISDSVSYSTFNYHITQIENAIQNISGRNTVDFVKEELTQLANGFPSLIQQYQSLINRIGFTNNSSQILAALTRFDQQLSMFENRIQKYAVEGMPQKGSYLKRLTWVENQLKGYQLEVDGVDFFQQRLPQEIKVLQTGQILGPRFNILGSQTSTGKFIKEDLMLLIDKGIKIEYSIKSKNGNKMKVTKSLSEFIEDCSNPHYKTITLTLAGYRALQEQMIAGVTSKATRAGKIRFGAISLDNLSLESVNFQTESLLMLSELYLKFQAPLQKTHEDYDALFNYSLARALTYIIGQDNTLILTRNGISTTADFLAEQFKKGNYLKIANSFDLSKKTSKNYDVNIDIK